VCFAALALAPRRRAPDLRRLAWLLVAATLVLATGPARGNPLLVAAVLLAAAAVVAFAVATLRSDPRLAIAGAVPLSNLALGVVTSHSGAPIAIWLCLAAAPAALLVAQKTGTSV
jgi:hypothetical protein